MTQVVARLDDALAADLDALVSSGAIASRSEGIRVALERLIDDHRRQAIGRQIVAGYEAIPPTDADGGWSDDATVAMIAEEPW